MAELGHVTTKVGVDAAVFDDDGRILLVRRADNGRLGLIGGWVDPGEEPEVTATRELAEETGVEGSVDALVGLFTVPAGAVGNPHGFLAVVYLCSVRSHDFTPQEHEVIEVGWHDLDAVTGWHMNHETYARAAREEWRRHRA